MWSEAGTQECHARGCGPVLVLAEEDLEFVKVSVSEKLTNHSVVEATN